MYKNVEPTVSLKVPFRVPSSTIPPNLSFNGMMGYGVKVLGITDAFRGLNDPRRFNKSYPLVDLVNLTFGMLLLEYDSMNTFFNAPLSMQQTLENLLVEGTKVPNRSTVENALEKIDPEQLRDILWQVAFKAHLNGALDAAAIDGWITAIIDGTEHYKSMLKDPCGKCLKRTHGNGIKEHNHKSVVLEVPAGRGQIVIDYDMLGSRDPEEKDEGEMTGAKRILERMIAAARKMLFDILTGDALYANAPLLNAVLQACIDAVVRIKGDDRLLIKEADRRFEQGHGKCESFVGELRNGDLWFVTAWYDDDFHMEGVDKSLRCVRFTETPILPDGSVDTRKDCQGKLLRKEVTSYMISTSSEIAVTTIWKIMHQRWDIEDCVFHQLHTYYHLDHLYSHKCAEQILILTLLAFNLRELYLLRFRARHFAGRGYTFKDVTRRFRFDVHEHSVREVCAVRKCARAAKRSGGHSAAA